jgi:hypothetical protein
MEQDNKRNLAKVHYQKFQDGTIQIVHLEGFLSFLEIKNKHGRLVLDEYRRHLDHMATTVTGQRVCFSEFPVAHLAVGRIYSKDEFSLSIAKAKACGIALSGIIKESRKPKKLMDANTQEVAPAPAPIIKVIEI